MSTAEQPPQASVEADDDHRTRACAAPAPSGATAHTRAYADGRLVAEGFDVGELSEHRARGFVWLALLQPGAADMRLLAQEFGLHPLAIEDALGEHQRPKLDRYDDHAFLAA